jgi:hypothetical protein
MAERQTQAKRSVHDAAEERSDVAKRGVPCVVSGAEQNERLQRCSELETK